MKTVFRLLFVVTLPLSLFGHDTTLVKQQANVLAQAVIKGDYKTLVDHMYPRVVAMMGGKEKMLNTANTSMANMKAEGIVFENATIGSPGKFYRAGKEIHCLVPETITLKMPKGHVVAQSYLLAISADGGKTWSFIDLNKNTINNITKMFPYFNPELKIPEPTEPVMQP
jgi:hypothetical protein